MDPRERLIVDWNLRPNMTMLEYGSGASTLHFSRHFVLVQVFLLPALNELVQACGAVLQRGALSRCSAANFHFYLNLVD